MCIYFQRVCMCESDTEKGSRLGVCVRMCVRGERKCTNMWFFVCKQEHEDEESQQHDLLQHTATHRNTLQHTATHCNTLQHNFLCVLFALLAHTYVHMHTCIHCIHARTRMHAYTHEYTIRNLISPCACACACVCVQYGPFLRLEGNTCDCYHHEHITSLGRKGGERDREIDRARARFVYNLRDGISVLSTKVQNKLNTGISMLAELSVVNSTV